MKWIKCKSLYSFCLIFLYLKYLHCVDILDTKKLTLNEIKYHTLFQY